MLNKLKVKNKKQEIFTAGISRNNALFRDAKLKTILSKSTILILFLLIASLSTLVFSRTSFWTTNLVNLSLDSDFTLFVDVTNNRVGINTSDPTATLQVNGSVRVVPLVSCDTIDTDADGLMSCGSDDAGGASAVINSSEYVYINDTFPKAVNLSNVLFVNGSSGRVGIGTTLPSFLLTSTIDDVNNNTIANVLAIEHTATNRGVDGIGASILFRAEDNNTLTVNTSMIAGLLTSAVNDSVAGALAFYTRTGGSALAERARIDGGGNLNVTGTVNATTFFQAGSKAVDEAYALFNRANFSSEYTTIGYKKENVTGVGLNLSTLNVSGHTLLAVSSGNVSIGTTDSLDKLYLANGALRISGNNSAGIALNVSNVLFVNASSSRVGIGAPPSNTALQVKNIDDTGGIIRVGSDASDTSPTRRVTFGDGTSLVYIGETVGTDDELELNGRVGIRFETTSSFTQMFISQAGNVGINTTSPTSTLQVQGTLNVSGGQGASALYVATSGNVGINTTTPTQMLTVSGGNISIKTNNMFCWDGTACTRYTYYNGSCVITIGATSRLEVC